MLQVSTLKTERYQSLQLSAESEYIYFLQCLTLNSIKHEIKTILTSSMERYWQHKNSSLSPAGGLLCDGACRKRIGGTFHTLGAAWWGVGSSLMNRVHLAES